MDTWKIDTLELDTVASFVGIDIWDGPGFIDSGTKIPGVDGVEHDPLAPLAPWQFGLRVVFNWSDGTGDDALLEGRNKVLAALYKPAPVLYATIGRSVGAVRTPVKLVGSPVRGGDRNEYVFPLRSPIGGFQDASASTATGTPPTVVTKGTKRIADPVVTFSADGTYTHTWTNGRKFEIVAGSGPTYPVVVDVGARTVVDDDALDAASAVEFSDDSWLMLEAAATLSQTASVEVTVAWRNLW